MYNVKNFSEIVIWLKHGLTIYSKSMVKASWSAVFMQEVYHYQHKR